MPTDPPHTRLTLDDVTSGDNGLMLSPGLLAALTGLSPEAAEAWAGTPVMTITPRDAVGIETVLNLSGTMAFRTLGLHEPVKASMCADIATDGATIERLRLTLECPDGWAFTTAFPRLPAAWPGRLAPIRDIALTGGEIVLSTHNPETCVADPGLWVRGEWAPGGLLGVLEALLQTAGDSPSTGALSLTGRVRLAGPETADHADDPWRRAKPVRGVYLEVAEALGPGFLGDFGDAVQIGLRLFSPLATWSGDCATDAPATQLFARLGQQAPNFEVSGRLPDAGDERLILTGRLAAGGCSSALSAIGCDGIAEDLPIGDLLEALSEASVALVIETGGEAAHLAAITLEAQWETPALAPGFGEIPLPVPQLRGLRLAIIDPLGAGRSWSCDLDATLTLAGVDFDARLQLPSGTFFAEHAAGSTPPTLHKLFDALHIPADLPRPPDLSLGDMTLLVEGDFHYALSVGLTTEDSSEIHATIFTGGWMLEIDAPESGGGISALDQLARHVPKVSEMSVELPPEVAGIALRSARIAYQSEEAILSVELTGEINPGRDGSGIQARVTIDSGPVSETGDIRTELGGEVTLFSGTEAECSFDLWFETDNSVSVLLGSYHDPKGRQVSLGLLDKALGLGLPESVREGFSFTMHDALLAGATTNGRLAVLAGIDLSAGFTLSAPRIAGLRLLDEISAGPPLTLDFQLLYADEALSESALSLVIRRSGAAALLPPDAPPAGLSLSARLQIDGAPRHVALPVGADFGQGNIAVANTDNPDPAELVTGNTQWFRVERSFGPLHVGRVGVDFRDGEVWALVDGDLSLAGLTVSLEGFAVHSPIKPFNPRFTLAGLGIEVATTSYGIAGAFLHQNFSIKRPGPDGQLVTDTFEGFGGGLTVQARDFALSATGLYAELNGAPSLFLSTVLNRDLGGPAFFHVLGLAAALGYNRDLILPEAEALEDFPLVAMARSAAAHRNAPVAEVLARLAPVVPPRADAGFVLLGVHFDTFKVIDSVALLSGKLADDLEFDIVGVSKLETPPREVQQATGEPPVAEATLGFKATFRPAEGTLVARAVLAPGAYALSRDCHLTGGFAFGAWFQDGNDITAGDFVVTIGGYHPDYTVPTHYPQVPRVGLRWDVNPNLTIKGNAYFALTQGSVMAGGCLEAVWNSGAVQASFTAAADFLMAWQPYHYDVRIYISIRAHVTVQFFGTYHLNFDAGARLHLQGPPFSGRAEVHVAVLGLAVDFDLAFGSTPRRPRALGWTTFRDGSLPKELCSLTVTGGLLREIDEIEERPRWIVDPARAAFAVTSAIPLAEEKGGVPAAGIPSMGIGAGGFAANLDVQIMGPDGGSFLITPQQRSFPAALWGDLPDVEPPPPPGLRLARTPHLNAPSQIEGLCGGYLIVTPAAVEGASEFHPPGPAKETEDLVACVEWAAIDWHDPLDRPEALEAPQARSQQIESVLAALAPYLDAVGNGEKGS